MARGDESQSFDPDAVPVCMIFASAETATQNVLAVPSLARALHAVRRAGWARCTVCVPGPFRPDQRLLGEIDRLAPALRIAFCGDAPDVTDTLLVAGERLASPDELAGAARRFVLEHSIGRTGAARKLSTKEAHILVHQASRELLQGTAKPGDGIVARHINRPISQRLTRWLLETFGPLRPTYATALTAMIAAAMFACLLRYPGSEGLMLGALLFQAASVVDGVDGEIARATFRATRFGASLDSLVDAATNVLFFIGVVTNLFHQGERIVAQTALAALGGLVFGTAILGWTARKRRGVIDFNVVKQMVAAGNSRAFQMLTWLTMRDFYAFAAAVLIGLGFIDHAVWAFAIIVAGWLLVVCLTLAAKRDAKPYSSVVRP